MFLNNKNFFEQIIGALKYNPAGQVITGDLNIAENISVRIVFAKGPKFRELQSINWKFNFKNLMDSVEDYARQWAKRKGVLS